MRHPIHSLCGYLGAFPPRVPANLLAKWFSPSSLIVDPFCGGGTTLVEAIRGGFPVIGIDRNPLAVAISAAKIQPVEVDDVLHRLSDLAEEYTGSVDLSSVPEEVRLIFHERTLRQLVYLRSALNSGAVDTFLRGAVLGIMHGKFRRDGTTAYLSLDMPNTFSMSPGYVSRFVIENSLSRPPVDAFGQLRERARWLLREGALAGTPSRAVIEGDSAQIGEICSRYADAGIGGVVTSPPYLGVLRYGNFNWIRLWFLGHDPVQVDRSLDTTDSLESYMSFIATFLMSAAEVLSVPARVVMVVGDVSENGQTVRLAERLWEELQGLVPYRCLEIGVDDFPESDKTTRIWGEEKRGRATPTDRVLVLERN